MFSAISSADMFSSHFCHVALSHISNLVPTPIIIASFSNFAEILKFAGIKNLPCLSISHSVAPDKKNLTKFLAFLSDSGNDFSFSSKLFHSFCENTNKNPSIYKILLNIPMAVYISS